MASATATASSTGGIGFLGLLTIVFITLKLTDVIAWSWFWVLSPIIIPWAIGLGFAIIIGVTLGVISLFESQSAKRRRKARKALDRYGKSVVR